MAGSVNDVIEFLLIAAPVGWLLWLVFRESPSDERPTRPDTTSSYKGPEPLWRTQRRKNPRLRRRRRNEKA